MEEYRRCFVPACKNDSKNSSKTIVRIPKDLRERWCHEVNVEYFQCYIQYCCEDHFDPEQDLTNFYFKSENKEPRFKPTAKLRNIGGHLQEEVSGGLQLDECESDLAKLLLPAEPQPKKGKYEEINKPCTSGSWPLFNVQVAVQATVKMMDKSTNTRFKIGKLNPPMIPVQVQSSQQSSSTPVSDSPSLFSFTSESEERETLIRKEFNFRKLNLEKIFKKPKMYLGLPKQYSTWLIL